MYNINIAHSYRTTNLHPMKLNLCLLGMFFRFLFLVTREKACSYLLSCSDTCIHGALKGGSLGSIH